MRWCRAHGIQPIAAERRSLQWWMRRFRMAAAAVLTVGIVNAASFQCCTCGTCLTIQADTLGTAWAGCVSAGQSSAWRVVAMRDEASGIEAAQRFDGCTKMSAIVAGGFDLCGDPCAKPLMLAQAGQYCHETGGACWAMPALPVACNGTVNSTPCPAANPTPTPSPVPTPTPTPLPYTVQQVLAANALGYSYVQAPTMIDGTVWGNGGVCCTGGGAGECEWVIDFNLPTPVYREWWCTYRDSSELYESLGPQVAHSDRYKWVVAGMANRRPAVPALQSEAVASIVWGFGVQSLTEQFRWPERVGRLLYQDNRGVWPLAILDLRGQRWLYCLVMDNFGGTFELWRFAWPDAYGMALWDSTTRLAVLAEPLSPIAIDKDGSLVATIDATPAKFARRGKFAGRLKWWPTGDATQVKVVRSTDEGRSWTEVTRFNAPAGKFLAGCGWEHTSGGGAVQPWHLLCVMSSGKGPDASPSDWNLADIRVSGAKVPASWGVKPAPWKAPTP